MANELLKKLRRIEEVQQVTAVRVIPKIIRVQCIQVYTQNKTRPYYRSRNSRLDCRA